MRSGAVDEHGMKTLVARAHAGDVTYLVAVLDRIAMILAERGDHTPLEVPPDHGAADPGQPRPCARPADRGDARGAGPSSPGRRRGEGHASPGRSGCAEHPAAVPWPGDRHDQGLHVDEPCSRPRPRSRRGGSAAVPAARPSRTRGCCGEVLTPGAFDPAGSTRSRSSTCTSPTPRSSARQRCGPGRGIGPAVLSKVPDWLTHPMRPDQIRQQVRVRPVLDAGAVHPVDAYEWPTAMTELAIVRNPYEVFPYGTCASRRRRTTTSIAFRPGPPRPDPAEQQRQARQTPPPHQDPRRLAAAPPRTRRLPLAHPTRPLAPRRHHRHPPPRPRPRPRRRLTLASTSGSGAASYGEHGHVVVTRGVARTPPGRPGAVRQVGPVNSRLRARALLAVGDVLTAALDEAVGEHDHGVA